MKNNKEIDNVFRQSFKDFHDSPSNSVWGGIEQKLLENNKHIHDKRKYRNVFFITLGLLFLVSSLFIWGWNFPVSSSKSQTSVKGHQSSVVNPRYTNNNSQSSVIGLKSSDKVKEDSDKTLRKEIITSQDAEIKKSIITHKKSENNSIYNETQINDNRVQTKENSLKSFSKEHNTNKKGFYITNTLKENKNITKNKSVKSLNTLSKKVLFLKEHNTSTIFSIYKALIPTQIMLLPKQTFFSRFSFSPVTQYSITYRKIKGVEDELNFYNLNETRSSSFSYGAKIGIDIKKSWRVETGIFLQNIKINTHQLIASKYIGKGKTEAMLFTSYNTNEVQFILKNSNGLSNGDIVDVLGTFTQETRWINIPILIGYSIYKGKFGLDFSAGLTANIFLDNKIVFDNARNKTSSFIHTFSEMSSKFHFSYKGEINIHYYPVSHINLFAGIHYQNAISSANKNKSIGFYPYMYGLQLGTKLFY